MKARGTFACLALWLATVATTAAQPDLPSEIRLTPAEIASMSKGGAGTGTSGVAGIRTTILHGDPDKAGPYTIEIRVPANTRIQAHTHRDARSAVVVSGRWFFGYGSSATESAVRELPPGSFYTEPANAAHFALTRGEPAVVYISGIGPTDTIYSTSQNQETQAMKTTIVLVHGAFADGSSWSRVIPLLQAQGFDVVAVQNPLSSLAADVAAAKRAMELAKGPVVLVGHSWGGAVITEAGGDDKVKALVYVAAFALDKGESVNDLLKHGPAPSWAAALRRDSAGFLTLPPGVVASDFAQDLDAGQTQLLAAAQGPWSERCLADVLTTGAWHSRPSWYVLAEADRMIDPAAQAAMATRIGATITRVPSSHVPMLSHPAEVAAAIVSAANSIR